MHLPVKFEFDWTKRFPVRVWKQRCGWTENWTNGQKNGKTNRRNCTNFKRNLAMMVIYVPVKYEFDWTNCFQVRVRKRKCGQTDGWTDKRTKNGDRNGRNFTNFKRNLAMKVIYLPVKFEFDWTNHFRVRVQKQKMWTDRRTDRRTHVTNPPKKRLCYN